MSLNNFNLFPNKEDNVEIIKPTTESFLEDFKDTLEKSGGAPKKPSGYYKPSCMNCMRCMYYLAKQIIPIEVKSSKNYTTSSLLKFKEKFHERIAESYIIHPKNLSIRDDGIICIPAYMTFCL